MRACAFAAGVLFLVSGEVAMAGDKHLGTEGRVCSADGRYEKQGVDRSPPVASSRKWYSRMLPRTVGRGLASTPAASASEQGPGLWLD